MPLPSKTVLEVKPNVQQSQVPYRLVWNLYFLRYILTDENQAEVLNNNPDIKSPDSSSALRSSLSSSDDRFSRS